MIWQRLMIGLARSPRATRFMQSRRSASDLAGRFVGGSTLEAAIASCRKLRDDGIAASLFYLGEYVSDARKVSETVERKKEAARALAEADMDVHVSVDPTQIGHLQSKEDLHRNAAEIAGAVLGASRRTEGRYADVLMLDMEDHALVDPTIHLYRDLRARQLPVALTLQAYLRRTEEDLAPLLRSPGMVRLVKGAFAAPAELAFTDRAAIRRSYLELARRMLSDEAAGAGFHPSFATHDHRLIGEIVRAAEARGRLRDAYEFEMLYGVRPDLQRRLSHQGFSVRAYVPFGRDWWPYAVRRVGERPGNGVLLLRALLPGA